MTKLQQLLDAQARMQDAKDMLNNFLEQYDASDALQMEELLDLELDVALADRALIGAEMRRY